MSTDAGFTPAPATQATPQFFPETLAALEPVNGRFYTQYGAIRSFIPSQFGYQKGGVTRLVFSDPCEITEIGLFLNANHGGTHNFRLGIYANDNNEPGAVALDAGTLTINSGSTIGINTIVLGTPYEVEANEVIWLACQCNHTSSYPTIAQHNSVDLMPYVNYGIPASGTFLANVLAFTLIADGANALPDPFVFGSPDNVHGLTPAVFVKVSV